MMSRLHVGEGRQQQPESGTGVCSAGRLISRAFSLEVPSTRGKLWKCTKVTSQPRFIIRQAATGESMPPESSAITLPPTPTGSPPGPRTSSKYTRASLGSISTKMLTSGFLRLTAAPVSLCTTVPRSRFISGEVRGKDLWPRLAVMRK